MRVAHPSSCAFFAILSWHQESMKKRKKIHLFRNCISIVIQEECYYLNTNINKKLHFLRFNVTFFLRKESNQRRRFTGGVAILPPSAPLQTPVQAVNVIFSLTLLKSTKNASPPAWRANAQRGVPLWNYPFVRQLTSWHHSEGVCKSNYV